MVLIFQGVVRFLFWIICSLYWTTRRRSFHSFAMFQWVVNWDFKFLMELFFHYWLLIFAHYFFLLSFQAGNILNIHDVPNIWHVPLLLRVGVKLYIHAYIWICTLTFICLYLCMCASMDMYMYLMWLCFSVVFGLVASCWKLYLQFLGFVFVTEPECSSFNS